MFHQDPFFEIHPRLKELRADKNLAQATFAGGCFWCMEGPFEALDGVEEAVVGFAGGAEKDPTYEQVANDKTSHREAVQVFFDPKKVTFKELLQLYWFQVDPTDCGGQFADRGHHYTTAVYYHNNEQQKEIERQIEELNDSGRYEDPICTEALPFTSFYPAEDYHQQFYQKQAEYYQRYKKGSGRADYIHEMERLYGQGG